MAYTDIDRSSDYFNTKLYSGTNTPQSITGVGFQPDWTWIKVRNVADNHYIYDSVRGATKFVHSDLTSAEGTLTNGLTSFDSDGFSLGDSGSTNNASNTFASWNWLAGGTASSNTDGSITSNVSANTTSGFSIVSYTGTGSNATVGHGLSAVPKMIIVKNRTDSASWFVYHGSLGTPVNEYLLLDSTNAVGSNSGTWNSNPTSSVFGLGSTFGALNGSSKNYIAYCFAEKKGFSKFGSYTGNGSTDGTFVYTGFKPAWVMFRSTSSLREWCIIDTVRQPNNPNTLEYPAANSSNAESTGGFDKDFLSNGFKLRSATNNFNNSGETYIYMAFASNPFVTSTGVPTTAR